MRHKIILSIILVIIASSTIVYSQQNQGTSNIVIRDHLCSGFKQFWTEFQKDVANNDTNAIMQCFLFPVRAGCFNAFNSKAYCDTGKFSWGKSRDTLKLTKRNFKHSYSTTFSRFLRYEIGEISSDMIEMSYNDSRPRDREDEDDTICDGVSVRISVHASKQYSPCYNIAGAYDVVLIFHFIEMEDEYKLDSIQCER